MVSEDYLLMDRLINVIWVHNYLILGSRRDRIFRNHRQQIQDILKYGNRLLGQ